MTKEAPTREPPLDPVEALKHIRTLVEVTFRQIMAILDKALPPRRRRPPSAQ